MTLRTDSENPIPFPNECPSSEDPFRQKLKALANSRFVYVNKQGNLSRVHTVSLFALSRIFSLLKGKGELDRRLADRRIVQLKVMRFLFIGKDWLVQKDLHLIMKLAHKAGLMPGKTPEEHHELSEFMKLLLQEIFEKNKVQPQKYEEIFQRFKEKHICSLSPVSTHQEGEQQKGRLSGSPVENVVALPVRDALTVTPGLGFLTSIAKSVLQVFGIGQPLPQGQTASPTLVPFKVAKGQVSLRGIGDTPLAVSKDVLAQWAGSEDVALITSKVLEFCPFADKPLLMQRERGKQIYEVLTKYLEIGSERTLSSLKGYGGESIKIRRENNGDLSFIQSSSQVIIKSNGNARYLLLDQKCSVNIRQNVYYENYDPKRGTNKPPASSGLTSNVITLFKSKNGGYITYKENNKLLAPETCKKDKNLCDCFTTDHVINGDFSYQLSDEDVKQGQIKEGCNQLNNPILLKNRVLSVDPRAYPEDLTIEGMLAKNTEIPVTLMNLIDSRLEVIHAELENTTDSLFTQQYTQLVTILEKTGTQLQVNEIKTISSILNPIVCSQDSEFTMTFTKKSEDEIEFSSAKVVSADTGRGQGSSSKRNLTFLWNTKTKMMTVTIQKGDNHDAGGSALSASYEFSQEEHGLKVRPRLKESSYIYDMHESIFNGEVLQNIPGVHSSSVSLPSKDEVKQDLDFISQALFTASGLIYSPQTVVKGSRVDQKHGCSMFNLQGKEVPRHLVQLLNRPQGNCWGHSVLDQALRLETGGVMPNDNKFLKDQPSSSLKPPFSLTLLP